MFSLGQIIINIIHGDNNFCCLCLKIDQNVALHDEINIEINETEHNVSVSAIIQAVFGDKIFENWSIFENICEDCHNSIIAIYKFTETCKQKALLLTRALVTLKNSLDESVKNENDDMKTLFVSVNSNSLSSKHIYDGKKVNSLSLAATRYNYLTTPKIHSADLKLSKNMINQFSIKTSDFLLNPHDGIPICKECLKSYPSVNKLRIHYMRVHAPKDYKCPKCSKKYSSPNLVEYHMNFYHSVKICCECGKRFNNMTTLKRHESSHNLKLVCPDCGRIYRNSVTYKNHIQLNVCKQKVRASPANAQYTCDYCGKKYTQKMSLRVHIQYTHGNYKAHVCTWCDKKFWAQSRLKAHIVKHTKEKNFTCSICDGKFVTKESLLYHTRLHTGEKPYKCLHCDCTFISSSRKAYHMRTYHLQPVVECETCHSKFASHAYLEKHKKMHRNCHKSQNIDSKINIEQINADSSRRRRMEKSIKQMVGAALVTQTQFKKLKNPVGKDVSVESNSLYVDQEKYVIIESEISNDLSELSYE